jgi:hypothetical protein
LRLTSFVWPHDLHRYERLRAALAVAAAYPVTVDSAPASSWLASILEPASLEPASLEPASLEPASLEPASLEPASLEPASPDGVLTVVWHSITRQYWPPEEIAATSRVIEAARSRMPIAHIAMESPVLVDDRAEGEREYRPAELTVQLSVPGTLADPAPVLLGTVADHGVPVRLASAT